MSIFENARDSEYFVTSLRLADVCESLGKNTYLLTERQIEDLSWAEDLMKRVDWRNPEWNNGGDAEIAFLATNVRPFFYELLLQNLNYNGIDFLGVLDRKNRDERDVEITRNFLKLLSGRCFAECQRDSYSGC